MSDNFGVLLENFYNRQYTSKLNVENSSQSLETLTNESNNQLKIAISGRNVNFKDIKSEHENNDNLFEDDNKLSDKSTTLFRTSHEYDTFLPSIESVVTDNDLSDLAHEFEVYGKSFSRDSISIEKEERDILFPLTESPKKDFSEKFKVEIDPKTKYTYNNLYNINTEIYSPSKSPYKSNYKSNLDKIKFIDDGERLDIRYIQNALLFNNKKDERELSSSNEIILKSLNDSSNKRTTKSSFMDIDFDLNTKHLSAITKIEKDNLSIKEDDDITLCSKNRMSYQSTRPTYLTNHQPAQPLQLNIYNKKAKRISSPKPSPLSESNIDHYNRMENNYGKTKINKFNNFEDYNSSSTEKEIKSPTENIPSKEYNIDNSTSSDDIPLANITQRKINSLSTPTLSSLSISVPDDKKSSSNMTSVSNDKSRKLKTKPLIDLTNENIDYLKPEFSNSIANDSPERKVSTKMPKKKKKKKNYFSHCCSSKVLENNYAEESNRSINKERYIKYQKDQIHSFEAKRLNSSKVEIDNLSSPNLKPTYMKRKSGIIEYKKETNAVYFNSNYLNKKPNEISEIENKNIINRNQSLSSVSSNSSMKSSKNSNTESSSSNSNSNTNNKNQGITSEKEYITEKKNDYFDINLNNKSPPKSIIIPTNQPNSQYSQSKKDENIISNISSTQNKSSTKPPTLNNRKKQEIKYCTSYEIDENGNWKLVERRYNDSKILKVETISRKMI
ncbi:hypothetical protein H8356DRAFT_1357906 [Neocallimastix lanati (nom. inval.)]|jgi:hypothetical protein|nr:hypothetical protein H8356DRAFT_1357906 [Neocallimastix sp. JGI-2020a]